MILQFSTIYILLYLNYYEPEDDEKVNLQKIYILLYLNYYEKY